MKKTIAILLLLCGAVALGAQTTGPTLSANAQASSSACVSMGGLKPFCDQKALLEELVITAQSAYQSTVSAEFSADEARITKLESVAPLPGPKGDPGPQGIPGSALPPGTVNFTSTQITGSSPAVRLDFASCVPTSQVVGWISAGQTVDFTVPISLAGNYLINACVSSTGGATYHFEFPVGTKVGASLTAPNTAAWHIYGLQSATATVALPVGNAVIRVVFETAGMNFGGGSLVKQ